MLSLIGFGFTSAQIENKLFISLDTVNIRSKNILRKTFYNGVAEIVIFGFIAGEGITVLSKNNIYQNE